MALPSIKDVDIHYINNWFSNFVDNSNFNINKIEGAVVTLDKVLNTIDTAPIQYLTDSLNNLVSDINMAFKEIESRLKNLESNQQGG